MRVFWDEGCRRARLLPVLWGDVPGDVPGGYLKATGTVRRAPLVDLEKSWGQVWPKINRRPSQK